MNRKTFNATVTQLADREILFKISDASQDRDEDIVDPLGCDFSNFAKNPQFLGFHNYWDFPLGTPKKWWSDASGVYAIVYFPTIQELATDPTYASEKAKLVDTTYCMYKAGMLSAVSVGFMPKELKPNPASESGYGKIISKWELYEFSAVPVPANPNALALGVKSGAITDDQRKAMMDAETGWREKNPQEENTVATKEGRRISAATKEALDRIASSHEAMKDAMDAMAKEHDVMAKCLKDLLGTEEPDDDGSDDEDDTDEGSDGKAVVLRIVE